MSLLASSPMRRHGRRPSADGPWHSASERPIGEALARPQVAQGELCASRGTRRVSAMWQSAHSSASLTRRALRQPWHSASERHVAERSLVRKSHTNPITPMSTPLTAHFSLDEMTRSSVAQDRGISNVPSVGDVHRLGVLCNTVLEPLRVSIGRPIIVTSGYRCAELNKAVGGAVRSWHTLGRAVDIKVVGMEPSELARVVRALRLPVIECVIEPSWLHLAI